MVTQTNIASTAIVDDYSGKMNKAKRKILCG
jgi:hypothetical protein